MYIKFISEDDQYRCYFCPKTSASGYGMIEHCIRYHQDSSFSCRQKILNDQTGQFGYIAKHFNMKCSELRCHIDMGYKVILDFENVTIRMKRGTEASLVADSISAPKPHSDEPSTDESSTMDSITGLIPGVIEILKRLGKVDDFISVLKSIADGTLDVNIAMHLLLDVGGFLRQQTVYSMRYHDVTREFWTLVLKLFRGKGIRFFPGLKGEGQDPKSGL